MPITPIPVLVSANGEWAAVRAILQPNAIHQTPLGESFGFELSGFPCLFFHSGWGKISTASAAQFIIDRYQPDLIINLGTCGGFEGFSTIGETLIVNEVVVYDIFERMDDPIAALKHYQSSNGYSWIKSPLPPNTRFARLASADQDVDFSAFDRLTKTHQAVAADWETGAFAWVAARNQTPWLALRSVSDLITRHASETDGEVDLWRSRLERLMGNLLADLPFYLKEFTQNNCSPQT